KLKVLRKDESTSLVGRKNDITRGRAHRKIPTSRYKSAQVAQFVDLPKCVIKNDSSKGRSGKLVIESFVVDIPDGNTKDDACYFVKALINCNLKFLYDISK
ncbi:abscisic acid receptor PYL9, partial [Tanacetum coccineum]